MSKSSSLTNNWLRYWRNSLADGESGKGSLKKEDLKKYLHLNVSSFQTGRVDVHSVVKKLFKDEDDKTQLVKIIVRPKLQKGLTYGNTHGIRYTKRDLQLGYGISNKTRA